MLLFCAAVDLLAPPPVARHSQQCIPGGEGAFLPECGHSAYCGQLVLRKEAVLDFIDRSMRSV